MALSRLYPHGIGIYNLVFDGSGCYLEVGKGELEVSGVDTRFALHRGPFAYLPDWEAQKFIEWFRAETGTDLPVRVMTERQFFSYRFHEALKPFEGIRLDKKNFPYLNPETAREQEEFSYTLGDSYND